MSDPNCPVGLECGNHPPTREGCTCAEYDLRETHDPNADNRLPPPPVPEGDILRDGCCIPPLSHGSGDLDDSSDPDVKVREDDGSTYRTRCSPRGYCFVMLQASVLGPAPRGIMRIEYRDMMTRKPTLRLVVVKQRASDGGIVLDFCPWCRAPLHFEWKDGVAIVANAPQD